MKTLLSRASFNKRSGTPLHVVMYALVLWIRLKKESIGMFARDCLQNAMGKDVLYDTLNRKDLNWRIYRDESELRNFSYQYLLGLWKFLFYYYSNARYLDFLTAQAVTLFALISCDIF
jgi:hypothetical protein